MKILGVTCLPVSPQTFAYGQENMMQTVGKPFTVLCDIEGWGSVMFDGLSRVGCFAHVASHQSHNI